jgi:hypothetical protein
MCVERRLVATCSPQNRQRALPGEMWTRCTANSMSGSPPLVKREAAVGSQASTIQDSLLERARKRPSSSSGSGKMIVEFFSAAISVSVCR